MDVLASASFVLQNEALTQNRFTTDVNALATGLRVRSAADDPSGYAIAQTIQTKVAGLQQSVTNVQTANNLLNVADGALNGIELILQRVRSLIVESNSDINSSSDLLNIQTEINQLLLEVNKISSETNFNGLTLFNGQFDAGTSGTATTASFTEVQAPILTTAGGQGANQVANSMIDSQGNATGPGPGPFIEPFHQTLSQQVPAFMVFQILSYSANAVDPDTGTNIGPGVLIQFQAYSQSPAMGAAPLYTDVSAVPINAGPIINAQYYAPISFGGGPPNLLIQFSVANLTQADVGATAAFMSTVASAPATGHSLNVNDGGDEGTTIAIDLPQINTNALNISDISVEAPATVNFMNQLNGQSSSNVMAAADAETRTDAALETITTIRAQVGAQMVSTQIDANSDDTATVQYQATVSNIRDANIGATVTDFTKQQILVSVSTSVLAHLQLNSTQLAALLLNSFSGPVIA